MRSNQDHRFSWTKTKTNFKIFFLTILNCLPKHSPKWKSYTHTLKQIFNDLRISFKISIVNGLNKLFSDFYDLLFACCQRKSKENQSGNTFSFFLLLILTYTQSHTMSFALVTNHLSEHSLLNACEPCEPQHANHDASTHGLSQSHTFSTLKLTRL